MNPSANQNGSFWVVFAVDGTDRFCASFDNEADAKQFAAERTAADSKVSGYEYRAVPNPHPAEYYDAIAAGEIEAKKQLALSSISQVLNALPDETRAELSDLSAAVEAKRSSSASLKDEALAKVAALIDSLPDAAKADVADIASAVSAERAKLGGGADIKVVP